MQNFWGVKEVHYGIVQVVNCSPLDFRQAVVSLLGQLTQTLSTMSPYRSMDEDTTAGRYYGIAYL